MLKPLLAASTALVFAGSALAQEAPAAKPAVFIAARAQSGSANAQAQDTVTLSEADTQAISQLLSECPGIQAAAKEIGADYTIRMSNQEGSKNQLQVLNAAGVIVASGLAGDNKSAVKDACNIVLSDFNNNGKAAPPVLDADSPMISIPSLGTAGGAVVPSSAPVAVSNPAATGLVTVSTPSVPAVTPPLAVPTRQPAPPSASSAAPSTGQAGTIRGTTVSAPDANAPYQASEPQQAESLGEVARRNRAAKAARQQQQQAQNQAPTSEAPH